jgi:hypothetical protein
MYKQTGYIGGQDKQIRGIRAGKTHRQAYIGAQNTDRQHTQTGRIHGMHFKKAGNAECTRKQDRQLTGHTSNQTSERQAGSSGSIGAVRTTDM